MIANKEFKSENSYLSTEKKNVCACLFVQVYVLPRKILNLNTLPYSFVRVQ